MSVEARKRKSAARAAPRKSVSRKPRLTLSPSVAKVKYGNAIDVTVAFGGVDAVELVMEPLGTFALDTARLDQVGKVRLLGKKDGIATLIASGTRRGKVVVQRMVHVSCEGPVLKILAFGYTPAGE